MTNSAIVARTEYSLAEIGRRITLYQQPGFGLERATQPQLNLLALYCQKMRLLPGEEVTLYEGRPWITVDGRVTLMRRHKDEYRGHKLTPLNREDKELWGYDPDDIVVCCAVRTETTGVIEAYGKVSKAERMGTPVAGARHNPVAKIHPVEIAMKRALARGERFAFGTAHDDEDPEEVARIVIEERRDPERVRALSDDYQRIIGSNYDDEEPAPVHEDATRKITAASDPLWQRWQATVKEAHAASIEVPPVDLGISAEALEASIADLSESIRDTPEQAGL